MSHIVRSMSHVVASIWTSCARCPTSWVRSRLRAFDVPHRAFDLDLVASMSHIVASIWTSCLRCPTSCLRSGLRALDVPHRAFDPTFVCTMFQPLTIMINGVPSRCLNGPWPHYCRWFHTRNLGRIEIVGIIWPLQLSERDG